MKNCHQIALQLEPRIECVCYILSDLCPGGTGTRILVNDEINSMIFNCMEGRQQASSPALQVGRSLYLLGKNKAALEVYEEARRIGVDDREIWHSKGLCYMYMKKYEE